MVIEFACKQCSRDYRVHDDMKGKKIRCKECSTIIAVKPQRKSPKRRKRPAQSGTTANSVRLSPSKRSKSRRPKGGSGAAKPLLITMVLVVGIGLFAFGAFQFFKHSLVAGSNTADHNSPQPEESGTAPDPVVVREELKRLVQSAGNAAVRGDADGALEHTYPPVIDAMGGMDSARRTMATVLQQMKQSGMTFASFDIDEPKDVMEANGMSFSIIPTRATLKLPTGRLLMSSYMLAISTDGQRTWKLVDGNGLKDPQTAKRLLPPLPPGFTLPPYREPQPLN